jgi:hypothetical protein
VSFPNAEAGFTPNEQGVPAAPSFGRKKDAKQYAAKCCIEWLMEGGHMPSDGVSVEFPKPPKTSRHASSTPVPSPAAKKPRAAATDNPEATPNRPRKRTTDDDNNNDNDNNDNNDDSDDDDDDDDDQPATKRVEQLCRLLCLTIPQYKITPAVLATTASDDPDPDPTSTIVSVSNPQFFDGVADFGPDAINVPEGLGRVSNVYGRRNAREKAAEEVLAWLVAEEGRRMAEVEEMMALVGEAPSPSSS